MPDVKGPRGGASALPGGLLNGARQPLGEVKVGSVSLSRRSLRRVLDNPTQILPAETQVQRADNQEAQEEPGCMGRLRRPLRLHRQGTQEEGGHAPLPLEGIDGVVALQDLEETQIRPPLTIPTRAIALVPRMMPMTRQKERVVGIGGRSGR